ncbi:TetR/AcrR family transcriptional regulator [Paracrocinitomix mangrovi]|uniref:TetR/AcrR family transcriptional regulator n=1 Tax=Paracrocinitomix mangrovi TaxID=2862509 RepID=UPI001C8D3429|nr:TetR/AcrR family transcriptional regulator [Paracrocinitomix mangrovi]UKN02246.1 TetR/AcrR family transcriptional regulator [Paracrocinitomix mangrovi]
MEYTSRQIEIINAATELINQGGIQQLTTKALAEKMGFSEPAIYRHFKNKTDILSSVLNYFGMGLKTKMTELIQSEDTGIEKLKQIIDFQFEHFSNHPAIVMVIFAETSFQYEEKLSSAVHKILTNKKERVVNIIQQGQKDGSIRMDIDTKQLATIFMGSMRFTILQWRLNQYKSDLIKEGDLLWKSLEKLILSPNKTI